MSKNIMFIGFMSGAGGAQRSNVIVANGLSRRGYKVTVVSLNDDNLFYKLDNDIEYIFIPNVSDQRIKTLFKRLFKIRKITARLKPDIVISFWLQPLIFAVFLSKFMGYKTIYSERGDPSHKEYKGLLGVLRKIFFKFTDGFVFQTKYAQNYFNRKIIEKSIVIRNPVIIPRNKYKIPQRRQKKIINVGRLHEQKNQKLLINAFAKISALYKDYTLEIYGEGSLRRSLEKQIEQLGLKNRIFLKGTSTELFDEIIDASMFVLTSDYEGLPNVLMEALALGIPCISTDYSPGGVRELIKNYKNGIIVPMNSEKELVAAMKFLIENPNTANYFAENGRKIIETNSKVEVLKQWDEYITRLLKNKK